jgi:hypothetical protein
MAFLPFKSAVSNVSNKERGKHKKVWLNVSERATLNDPNMHFNSLCSSCFGSAGLWLVRRKGKKGGRKFVRTPDNPKLVNLTPALFAQNWTRRRKKIPSPPLSFHQLSFSNYATLDIIDWIWFAETANSFGPSLVSPPNPPHSNNAWNFFEVFPPHDNCHSRTFYPS